MELFNLFDFGTNEKGEYVNLVEENQKKWNCYSYEELIKGNENDDNFCVVAMLWHNSVGTTESIEAVREEIKQIADSKCYHYGNMAKGIYAYSYCIKYDNGEKCYWFTIENEKHIVVIRHCNDINKILMGEEKLSYPACAVYMFEKTDNTIQLINSGYGDYKNDIRYKILCDEFKILEFSTNRIYPNKKPKDFYEAEYKLPDFIKYWGENNEESENEEL